MKIESKDLKMRLSEGLARHHVAGASIAVLYKGELITAAAGVTNIDTGVEVTPDTVMHIGSITKIFNATLVMQMVDAGRLDLEERVVRYLPDLKLKDHRALEQITVKMLLNHTSGIDGEMLPDHGHDEETIEKGIARFANLGQLAPPGAEYSYCNAATVIAGYLAQKLTGRSWYRLLRERIFEPLQMKHAVALPEEALLHRASVGHYYCSASKTLRRTSFAFLPLSFAPCGTTLMTSASDLITFAGAHMEGGVGINGARVLSERSAQAMQRMTMSNKGKGYTGDINVGIGWMIFEDGLLHHAGGGPGIVSVLYAYPEHEFAAAILCNTEHGFVLINEFMEPWLKEFGAMRPYGMGDITARPERTSIDLNKYVGTYEAVQIRFNVSRTSDGLALSRQFKFASYESMSRKATDPARLNPLGDDKFLLESDGTDGLLYDAFRVFTFRNPDAEGFMQHLGYGMRLYRRVSHSQ